MKWYVNEAPTEPQPAFLVHPSDFILKKKQIFVCGISDLDDPTMQDGTVLHISTVHETVWQIDSELYDTCVNGPTPGNPSFLGAHRASFGPGMPGKIGSFLYR